MMRTGLCVRQRTVRWTKSLFGCLVGEGGGCGPPGASGFLGVVFCCVLSRMLTS